MHLTQPYQFKVTGSWFISYLATQPGMETSVVFIVDLSKQTDKNINVSRDTGLSLETGLCSYFTGLHVAKIIFLCFKLKSLIKIQYYTLHFCCKMFIMRWRETGRCVKKLQKQIKEQDKALAQQ